MPTESQQECSRTPLRGELDPNKRRRQSQALSEQELRPPGASPNRYAGFVAGGRPSKVDEEGVVKQSFSLELVPHTLTGRAFYKEMQTFVTNTYLSHDWCTTWTEQAHRVYEDKKSGAARDTALTARDTAAAAAVAAAACAAAAARKAALLSAEAPILAGFAVNFGPIGTAAVGDDATGARTGAGASPQLQPLAIRWVFPFRLEVLYYSGARPGQPWCMDHGPCASTRPGLQSTMRSSPHFGIDLSRIHGCIVLSRANGLRQRP